MREFAIKHGLGFLPSDPTWKIGSHAEPRSEPMLQVYDSVSGAPLGWVEVDPATVRGEAHVLSRRRGPDLDWNRPRWDLPDTTSECFQLKIGTRSCSIGRHEIEAGLVGLDEHLARHGVPGYAESFRKPDLGDTVWRWRVATVDPDAFAELYRWDHFVPLS